MVIVATRAHLRAELMRARADAAVLGGGRVVLIPTTGGLEEWHLGLVDEARTRGDVVVVNVVEPAEGDTASARAHRVDLLFAPSFDEMFPVPPEVTVVAAGELQSGGNARSRTLGGPLTLFAKLFHLVMPDVAIFGRGDAQLATLVRAMVRDLDMPIEIVAHGANV